MLTYGYRDVNGRIELDPETAPLMREFFRLSARGMALRPAAEKAGIPIRAKWKREGGISRTALATALKNPVYMGTEHYPALIDAATFQTVANWTACRRAALPFEVPERQEPAHVDVTARFREQPVDLNGDVPQNIKQLYEAIVPVVTTTSTAL